MASSSYQFFPIKVIVFYAPIGRMLLGCNSQHWQNAQSVNGGGRNGVICEAAFSPSDLNEDIWSLRIKTHFDESRYIWTNGKRQLHSNGFSELGFPPQHHRSSELEGLYEATHFKANVACGETEEHIKGFI